MSTNTSGKRSLESLRIFPYVAWGLVILFTVFVYNLAVNLQVTAAQLEAKTTATEIRAKTPAEAIKDFEAI